MTVYETPVKDRLERLRRAVRPLGYVMLYKPLKKHEEFQLFHGRTCTAVKKVPKYDALDWTHPEWTIRYIVKRWERERGIKRDWKVRD